MKSTAKKKLGRGESQKGEDKRWRRSEMEKVRRERNWDVEKVRREKKRDGESQKKEDAGARGSKGRLAKAAGVKDEKLHAVVARSTF